MARAPGAAEGTRRAASRIAELPQNATKPTYFDYRVKGGDETTRPVRVLDDGKKTYIPMGVTNEELRSPRVSHHRSRLKQEMVNYRVNDDMYIVDRPFERAALILGSGKKAPRLEISR